MSKYYALVLISYPISGPGMAEKIKQALNDLSYKKYDYYTFTVGGGTIDDQCVFLTPFETKKEAKEHVLPFLQKLDFLKPDIDFVNVEDYEKHNENDKKRDLLKSELQNVYEKLKEKHSDDKQISNDLDHIFCNVMPPAWKSTKI